MVFKMRLPGCEQGQRQEEGYQEREGHGQRPGSGWQIALPLVTVCFSLWSLITYCRTSWAVFLKCRFLDTSLLGWGQASAGADRSPYWEELKETHWGCSRAGAEPAFHSWGRHFWADSGSASLGTDVSTRLIRQLAGAPL